MPLYRFKRKSVRRKSYARKRDKLLASTTSSRYDSWPRRVKDIALMRWNVTWIRLWVATWHQETSLLNCPVSSNLLAFRTQFMRKPTSKSINLISSWTFCWSIKPTRHCKVSNQPSELKFLQLRKRLTRQPDLSVEFATLGDLKVVERPTTQNLAPRDFLNVQSTIKVSSTDTGNRIIEELNKKDPITNTYT